MRTYLRHRFASSREKYAGNSGNGPWQIFPATWSKFSATNIRFCEQSSYKTHPIDLKKYQL